MKNKLFKETQKNEVGRVFGEIIYLKLFTAGLTVISRSHPSIKLDLKIRRLSIGMTHLKMPIKT